MKVSIWDKVRKKWLHVDHVKYVVQLDTREFQLDDIKYDTDVYELNFIHAKGD